MQHMQGYAGKAMHSIQQQVQRLTQTSQYDAELLHLAVPALAAMLLEPLMNVVSAGEWLV
jgi:Na+-driven multidrug efflux pump